VNLPRFSTNKLKCLLDSPCFLRRRPYSAEMFALNAEPVPRSVDELDPHTMPTTACLHEIAKTHGMYIIGGTCWCARGIQPGDSRTIAVVPAGSYPERCGDRIYNTCVCFDPNGAIIAKFRKIHLFDIHIEDRLTFVESGVVSPGSTLGIVGAPLSRERSFSQ
jgi:predicted amidohydrolase